MTIFVTGGAGHIGSHVLMELRQVIAATEQVIKKLFQLSSVQDGKAI